MTSTSTARRRTAPLAVGALATALALTACGNQVAGSGGDLPTLRIGTGTYAGADAAVAGSGSSDGLYPLEGTLPTGPATAQVRRWAETRLPVADVSALASSLGLSGTPARHDHGWQVASSGGLLRVRDGGTAWSFARGTSQCPAYSVDVDRADAASGAVGCAVASPGSSGAPASGSVPGDDAALAAAAPVLAAAGLRVADARLLPATTGYAVRTVVVDPLVDGLPASGVRTLVDVDADGVLGAMGVLSAPTAGDAYPIITASAALDLLRAMPQPEIAMACAVGQKCPGVGPHVVTGTQLGLMTAYDGGVPVLVPAWLFTVRGSEDLVPVVAVERRYLADPPQPGGASSASAVPPNPGPSDVGSVPGSSGAGAPGSPVPRPRGGCGPP